MRIKSRKVIISAPPSGLNPAAMAIASSKVDLPLPFSPTKKVMGLVNSRLFKSCKAAISPGNYRGNPIPVNRKPFDKLRIHDSPPVSFMDIFIWIYYTEKHLPEQELFLLIFFYVLVYWKHKFYFSMNTLKFLTFRQIILLSYLESWWCLWTKYPFFVLPQNHIFVKIKEELIWNIII